MMKKIESFNKKKICDKVKQHNKGRCGRKAAMKWIRRRLKAREELEKERKKIEESVMGTFTRLPPGFSAQIQSVRKSNEDGDTDEEEEEIPFEESSDEDENDGQRIFTISAFTSNENPPTDEALQTVGNDPNPPTEIPPEVIEYYPTPPAFPETSDESADEFTLPEELFSQPSTSTFTMEFELNAIPTPPAPPHLHIQSNLTTTQSSTSSRELRTRRKSSQH